MECELDICKCCNMSKKCFTSFKTNYIFWRHFDHSLTLRIFFLSCLWSKFGSNWLFYVIWWQFMACSRDIWPVLIFRMQCLWRTNCGIWTCKLCLRQQFLRLIYMLLLNNYWLTYVRLEKKTYELIYVAKFFKFQQVVVSINSKNTLIF